MSEREIMQKLRESRNEGRLHEAWLPLLNKLSRYEQNTVRDALNKAGIDIENTPYREVQITSGRDPRLKGTGVVIFDCGRSNIGVWFKGKFIVNVDVNVGSGNYKRLSQMSWKDIFDVTERIYHIEFDEASAASLQQKKADRKAAQAGRVMRYNQKTKPRYATLDKSGYIIDPNKYKKMFAELNVKNADILLKQAADMYAKLATKLATLDMEAEDRIGSFDGYNYIMKEIPNVFKSLTKHLKEYNNYPAAKAERDSQMVEYLQKNVQNDIIELRNLINKARKYTN